MNPEPASEQPTSLSPFAVEPRNPPPLPRKGAPKEDFADDDLAVVRPRPLWPTLVVAAVASLFVGGAATAYASKSAPKPQVQMAAAAMAPALPPLESRKIPPPPAHVDIPPVAPAAPVSDVPVSAVMDAPGARADSPTATPVKAAAPTHHASTPAPATPKAHAAPPPPAQKKAAPPAPAKPIAKAKPVEAKKATKAPPAKKKS